MKDFKNYIITGLLVACIGLIISNLFYKSGLKDLAAKNGYLTHSLKIQNAVIEKNKISLEKYEKERRGVVNKIETKYKTIKVKDNTCDAKLQAIKEAVDNFYINR